MWKKIVLGVAWFAAGLILGSIISTAYIGRTISKAMFVLQEKEIFRMGEAAEEAYYNEPNEVAVWALENYIKTLNEIKEERATAGVENLYFALTPDSDLVFAHLRLGKLYKKMGNEEKSRYHFEQAISKNKGLNTEEDCVKMLEALDKIRRERLE